MGIEITQQKALIEINTHNARIHLRQPKPSFKINSTPAKMEIRRKLPTIRLDFSNHKLSIGNPDIFTATKKWRDEAYQKTLEAIGEIAEKGTIYGRIDRNVNQIAHLAAMKSANNIELNIAASLPPEIIWEEGYIEIDWIPHKMEIDWNTNSKVDIMVEPHEVKITMKQYPTIKISYKPKNHEKTHGRNIDKYV